ncbi:hypothetical protein A2U01_0025551 [Trifolium medium]|uniref:Uncharacterized protein n=1 Tax=Trifolium medium TaxID=97028 RepID=A0A392NYI4_9FABA|nr:hypothetical protein [Trifolium medium]
MKFQLNPPSSAAVTVFFPSSSVVTNTFFGPTVVMTDEDIGKRMTVAIDSGDDGGLGGGLS